MKITMHEPCRKCGGEMVYDKERQPDVGMKFFCSTCGHGNIVVEIDCPEAQVRATDATDTATAGSGS